MNKLKALFSKIVGYFKSGKAEKAFDVVAVMVPHAIDIVERIAAMTPTKADDELLAAFEAFGVRQDLDQIQRTPAAQRGYLLLHLATEALALQFPGIATNLLNSAVQLAVSGIKA